MGTDDKGINCSFCGKADNQVRKIIAGPSVFICDQCIDLCNTVIEAENIPEAKNKAWCSLCRQIGDSSEMLDLESRGNICQECIPIVQAELIFWSAKNE